MPSLTFSTNSDLTKILETIELTDAYELGRNIDSLYRRQLRRWQSIDSVSEKESLQPQVQMLKKQSDQIYAKIQELEAQ